MTTLDADQIAENIQAFLDDQSHVALADALSLEECFRIYEEVFNLTGGFRLGYDLTLWLEADFQDLLARLPKALAKKLDGLDR